MIFPENPKLEDFAAYILVSGAYKEYQSTIDKVADEFGFGKEERSKLTKLVTTAKVTVEWPEKETD